jgi:hypothetical protein
MKKRLFMVSLALSALVFIGCEHRNGGGGKNSITPPDTPVVTPPAQTILPETFADLKSKFPALPYIDENLFSQVYEQGIKNYVVTNETYEDFYRNFIDPNGYAIGQSHQNVWLMRTDNLDYISFQENLYPNSITAGLRNYPDTSFAVTDAAYDAEFGSINGTLTHIDYYTMMLGDDAEAAAVMDAYAQTLKANGFTCLVLDAVRKQCETTNQDGDVIYRWLTEDERTSRIMAFPASQAFAELRANFPAFPTFDENRFTNVYQQGYKEYNVSSQTYADFYQNFANDKGYAVDPSYHPTEFLTRMDNFQYVINQDGVTPNVLNVGFRNFQDTSYEINDAAFNKEFGVLDSNKLSKISYFNPIMIGDDTYASQVLDDYQQVLENDGFACNVISSSKTLCEKPSADNKTMYQWHKADIHTSLFTKRPYSRFPQTFAQLKADFPPFPQFDPSPFSKVFEEYVKNYNVTTAVYDDFYDNFIANNGYVVGHNTTTLYFNSHTRSDEILYVARKKDPQSPNLLYAYISNYDDTSFELNDSKYDAEFGFLDRGDVTAIGIVPYFRFNAAAANAIMDPYAATLQNAGFTCSFTSPSDTICEKPSEDGSFRYMWFKVSDAIMYFKAEK